MSKDIHYVECCVIGGTLEIHYFKSVRNLILYVFRGNQIEAGYFHKSGTHNQNVHRHKYFEHR